MKKKDVLMALAMVVVLGLFLMVAVDEAFAQKKNISADKNIAQKKGFGALTTSKPEEKQDGATKLQMGIGVGSLFVMIAVMKYL